MEKQKFYQTAWFMWLCIVLLPPVGLIIVALKKDLEPKKKKTYLIIGAVWFVVVLIGGALSPKKEATVATATPTPEATAEATPEATPNTEGVTEEDKGSVIVMAEKWCDDFIANYSLPIDPKEWSWAKFDANNVLVASTKVTFDNESEKKGLFMVYNWDPETKNFTGHLLMIGDKIYQNDGYADAFLDEMQSLVQ